MYRGIYVVYNSRKLMGVPTGKTYPREELRILAALAHGGLMMSRVPAGRPLNACAAVAQSR
jgi:hypothetical protein